MLDRLQSWAAERGFQIGWGPLDVVTAARADVGARHLSRDFDVYASEVESTDTVESLEARGLTTVVVVVEPRPAHTVQFEVAEGRFKSILPPTYFRYTNRFGEVGDDLRERGLPGARVELLRAPLKQVASRLGLVSYGRNNLTYAPGLGSYIQLLGYLTDARLPLPDRWRTSEPALVPRCETCRACLRSCPTGAVGEDRVLLHAERCLTFANENAGEWQRWIDPKAHHCLLGCLICQRCCPENPRLPVEKTNVVFGREETDVLLAGSDDRQGPVWAVMRQKLARLGQSGSEAVLGRNLRALVANEERG